MKQHVWVRPYVSDNNEVYTIQLTVKDEDSVERKYEQLGERNWVGPPILIHSYSKGQYESRGD